MSRALSIALDALMLALIVTFGAYALDRMVFGFDAPGLFA